MSLSILRRIPLILFVCLLPVAVSAQHLAHGASGLPHGIPDFCATSPDALIVPAGQSVTLSGVVERACIGVHGTLTLATGLRLKADVLLVYADGALLGGTAAAPLVDVEVVIRDRLINPAADPEQFGQGVVALGRVLVHGQSATGEVARSVVIRSESPTGTRGHVLFSQRADVDLRYVELRDMGRTKATEPVHSTLFDAAGNVTRLGTNQIGRYSIHLHHVMGPAPNSGRPYQYVLVGNLIRRDSKWGVAIHNTHYGLIQDNVIVDGIGAGIVEEDGSETANVYRGNIVRRMVNPSMDAMSGDAAMTPEGRGSCVNSGYDPEGRCAAGFWFRGSAQAAVQDNLVEDARVGFGWWPLCLEINTTYPGSLAQDPARCAGEWAVTIPLFPGADTTDPTQRVTSCYSVYNQGVVPQCMVKDRARPVGAVDGNACVRAMACIEHWWDAQTQKGGGPILNTTTVDVRTPIANFYSDVSFDGLLATKTSYPEPAGTDFDSAVISEFNHGCPAAGHCIGSDATYTNFNAQGYLFAYRPAGQLIHPRKRTISNSTFGTKWGIHVDYGRQVQGIDGIRELHLTDVQFKNYNGGVAATTILTGNYNNNIHGESVEVMTVHATNFNGTTTDFRLVHLPEKDPSCTNTLATVVTAADGGNLTPIGLAPLCLSSVPQLPVDCVVSEWGPWSDWTPISATQEQRTRTRTVLTQPANGGAACPPLTETETRAVVVVPPPDPCVADPLTLTINRQNGWPAAATGSQLRWTANKPASVLFNPFTTPWSATATDARGCSVTVSR